MEWNLDENGNIQGVLVSGWHLLRLKNLYVIGLQLPLAAQDGRPAKKDAIFQMAMPEEQLRRFAMDLLKSIDIPPERDFHA